MTTSNITTVVAAALKTVPELDIPAGLTRQERDEALKHAALSAAKKYSAFEMGGHRKLYQAFVYAYCLLAIANSLSPADVEAFLEGFPGDKGRNNSPLALKIVRRLNKITPQATKADRRAALKRFSTYAKRLQAIYRDGRSPDELLLSLETRTFRIDTTPPTRPLIVSAHDDVVADGGDEQQASAGLKKRAGSAGEAGASDGAAGLRARDAVTENEADVSEFAPEGRPQGGRFLKMVDRDKSGAETVISCSEVPGRSVSGPFLQRAISRIEADAGIAMRGARLRQKLRFTPVANAGGEGNG